MHPTRFQTHALENLPTALPACNLWQADGVLSRHIERHGGGWAADQLSALGELAGGELTELGEQANVHRPRLHTFDRYGRRIDEVEFHPAYHRIMQVAMDAGVHAFSWNHADRPGAHVARAGLMYLSSQAEAGTACPLTMTHAAVAALRHAPDLATEWLPRITARQYDPRSLPAHLKSACTIGMGMTEKQGGSDVRSNSTRADRQTDGSYRLVGHKWFYSAPMCDAHLVLAQADAGLSCFLLPRLLPDGSLNAVRIQRLKDKLGDWSNASSEVEFTGAQAWRVGDEGRGVATILGMVALTRLDCMIGSAATMRAALSQALHHTSQRRAFGRLLNEQALMCNVLADLALESEAALALTLRVARAIDASAHDAAEAAFGRIATAVGKYWVCKRTPMHVNEAQECLGGIGYVEENILPRLYRQAPLNSIWEGSGNVQCLDVLRALAREPECREALLDELDAVRGEHTDFDMHLSRLRQSFAHTEDLEAHSRRLVEDTALALQAAELLRAGEPAIADAFCRSRLGGQHGYTFGTLPANAALKTLMERSRLQV